MGLWKSVENFSGIGVARMVGKDRLSAETLGEPGASQALLRACSACAGDYEDPDRTAWTPDEEEEDLLAEKVEERAVNGDEFPAQEA
jgi:hypothetical protein